MAVMASLDIVLNEYNLSDAQKNAVIELLSGGFTTAKANTIKSLEKRGLIEFLNGWEFEPKFREKLRDGYSQVEYRDEYDGIDDVEVAQAYHAIVENLADEAPFADGVERFQDDWATWEKELAGFGQTLKWRNTKVWDGLTAEEIADDLKTAHPVNRKARREGARIQRRLFREFTAVA